MRRLPIPAYDTVSILQQCFLGVSDLILRTKYMNTENLLLQSADNYAAKALAVQLFTIPANDCATHEVALGALTKSELYKLYTQYFAGKTKPARSYYDSLLLSTPDQKCPYCGFGPSTPLFTTCQNRNIQNSQY